MEQSGRRRVPARPEAATRTHTTGEMGDSGVRRAPRRSLRRLGTNQRAIPLLAVVALLSAFGLAAITYVGARANTIASAQTRALQDTQVLRQLIADQGPSLTSHDGTLVAGVDNQGYTINGDKTLVDRMHSLIGGYATIYALQGNALTAVASNLPAGKGNADGDTLTGAPFDALLGNCGAVDTQSCHQTYTGVLTLHGQDYVVGFRPLTDASGGFVGALAVALPSGDVLGPVYQLVVVLLLVGLLLSFLSIFGGSWFLGSRSDRLLITLDGRLDAVATSAAELERLARAQVERANQQGRAARQVSEQALALDAIAGTMEQSQNALRDSAGGIWQEMSQPGAAPDPQTALEWARQAAVAASRVGMATERSREACRQLVVMMNHVVAESDLSREGGRELQEQTRALREAVEGVERTVGDRLINRPHGFDALPLPHRGRRAEAHPAAANRASSPAIPTPSTAGRQREGTLPAARLPLGTPEDNSGGEGRSPAVSERLWLGRDHEQSGRFPAQARSLASGPRGTISPSGNSGQRPHVRPDGPLTRKQSRPPTLSAWSGQHRSMPPTAGDKRPADSGEMGRPKSANWSGEFTSRPRASLSDPAASQARRERPHSPKNDLGLPGLHDGNPNQARFQGREPRWPEQG